MATEIQLKNYLIKNNNCVVEIGFKDLHGKTCYEHAADGIGDNVEVIKLLIQHDHRVDKDSLSQSLHYFVQQESPLNSKLKWILEIVKSKSKIDFTYSDKNGMIISKYI